MTIKEMKDQGLLIFEGIVGSQAYGLATPTSDTDMKGVYIQPMDDILSFGYVEQISDEKNDLVYYEVRRFLELISTNNPNILELLNLPEECIMYKHPVYDLILETGDQFISKICKNSFAGYAIAQIKKARGLNKKIVNPVEKERKSPLDFCNVIRGNGTSSLVNWLKHNGLDQKFCGIVNISNAKDMYALYYDFNAHNRFSEYSGFMLEYTEMNFFTKLFGGKKIIKKRKMNTKAFNKLKEESSKGGQFLNYKGIVKVHEDGNFPSNQLRLSSIPKQEQELCTFSFNQDGYTKYCNSYKEYWDWVDTRNEARYNDNAKHGKGYDSKNMMHCHRLLDMAIEIGEGKGIIVRRPNREYLLSIRSGEMDYDILLADAERKIQLVDQIFENSNLQEKISNELCPF
jgi:hypothetical protein